MMDEYAIFPNIVDETVPASDLKLANAKMFAEALSSSGHSKLISCHIIISNQVPFFFKGTEFIIYDADIDVGQWPLNDIRYVERIAILFFANDNYTPLVFALRNSFPEVLHRVSMPFERPACLCIYDQSWGHQKLSWRPIKLMEDIRNWLSKTADGKIGRA